MVEEAGDSVTPQVKLALGGIPKDMCIPLLLRETDVSVQAFYPHYSFEAVKCVRFSGVVVTLLSLYLEAAFL